jgi:hypothetical protein
MVETAGYKVLKRIGDVEIRRYPEIILASTTLKYADDNSAFGILADYIFGNNKIRSKIPMTAPVITSERIAMTSPVITRQGGNGYKMSFVMPSEYSLKTLPKPDSNKVKIEVQKSRTVAVMRFSGFSNESKVQKIQKELIQAIEAKNIKIKSQPFLMRYNSPWSLPFMRKNEIGVEVVIKE